MSDDGSVDPYMSEYDESTMEVVIETLTGTTFEMTVSTTDTISSIKNKIQRVEGIPVAQQHLLFRMEEMSNDSRLCDHGVQAGSTLRLVLSMRGGPISTRRLTSTDHHLAWREIKEYVDNTREDILDKLPPGSKVTVLLFREGEHINLIRVIENEDGTCYPFSDSWLPVSRSKSKETSQTKLADRQMENNKMMLKVIELRRKMEGLSMQKKIRKPKTDSVSENTSCSTNINNEQAGACSSNSQFEHLPRIHGDFVSDRSISEMYTDRLLYIQQQRNKNNIGSVEVPVGAGDRPLRRSGGEAKIMKRFPRKARSFRPFRVDSSVVSPKAEELPLAIPGRNCSSTLQAPSIAILEEEPETSLNKKDADFTPSSPISIPSGDANTVTMSQIPSLPGTSRNLVHLAHMAHLVLDDHTERPKSSPEAEEKRDLCNILLNDSDRCHKMGVSNRRPSVDYNRSVSYNNTNLPRLQYTNSSSSSLHSLENTSHERERHINDWMHPSYSSHYHRSSNLLSSQYSSSSKLNNLDNLLGNRVTELNNIHYNEGRMSPVSMYGRRAHIERIQNNMDDKCGYNNLGYMANIEKIQNDSILKQSSSTYEYRRRNMSSLLNLDQKSENTQSYPKRRYDSQSGVQEVTSEIHTLPNILPKKTRTRCAMCNKRLNITTIHNCRCGGIFCAQHRYSEVHGCQYDYKTEGRKILEQANPLVAATKLPKI